jgi:hypothetical protein
MIYKTQSEFIEAYSRYRLYTHSQELQTHQKRLEMSVVLRRCYDNRFTLPQFGVGVMSQARKLMNHLFELQYVELRHKRQ